MTYREAYDKIIDAYFKDEIEPLHPAFCFCGTLCGNSSVWFGCPCSKHNAAYGYAGKDFVKMEIALLETIELALGERNWKINADYENALFSGMCAALDVLKEIHRERGEDVDGVPELTKRKESLS